MTPRMKRTRSVLLCGVGVAFIMLMRDTWLAADQPYVKCEVIPDGGPITQLTEVTKYTTTQGVNRSLTTTEEADCSSPERISTPDAYYHVDGTHLYLYRAYVDDRDSQVKHFRVFGLEKAVPLETSVTCSWITAHGDNQEKIPCRKYIIDLLWPTHPPYYAIAMDCPWVNSNASNCQVAPAVITLKLISKNTTSVITIPLTESVKIESRSDLAICLKPVTGDLDPARIIEWVEMQRAVGIQHIIVYQGDFKGMNQFVWEYYTRLGLVTVLTFPMMALLHQRLSPGMNTKEKYCLIQELYMVAMHDCLYRYRSMYTYLQYIDLDEVMLPTRDEIWTDTIKRMMKVNLANEEPSAALVLHTAWHFDDSAECNSSGSTEHLYMQKYCMATPPGRSQPKSVFLTSISVTVNFHSVVSVLPKHNRNLWYSSDYGYVHHFRGNCLDKYGDKDRCVTLIESSVKDPVIGRYQHNVRNSVTEVLEKLKLIV